MPIRVVVVDGHTMTRYGLGRLISEHPDIELAGEANSAAEAVRLLATARADVVTVDVTLPDGDGLRLARELRDHHADLGIVILTAEGTDDVLFRALDTGVSAFVRKAAPTTEILACIRHAAVAARSFTATGLSSALARRTTPARTALSPREREVLAMLGQGMSVPAISRAMFLSQSTTKTYVARLYEKLGAENRAQALMTGLRCGLLQHDRP